MLWVILAVALLLVATASVGPTDGLRKRARGRRGRAA